MRKARDLVGLPVMDVEVGEQVGEVRDVLFAPDGQLFALLLEKGGLLSSAKIVPRHGIGAIGQDAITIGSRADLEDFRDDAHQIRSLIEGDVPFVSKQVFTQDGTYLGTVEDVYMDEDLHTILGYEISEGFLVDLKEGRKVLPAHPEIMNGMDALLVPDHTELSEEL